MTRVILSSELVSDMLFGCAESDVKIRGCSFDPVDEEFIFEIEGDSVPECENNGYVKPIITVKHNTAGDRWREMKFEIIKYGQT